MSKYKVPSNLAISENGFLFVPNTGESFSLNEQGIEIFRKLQKGIDDTIIIESIAADYEVEKNEAEKDFTDFISQLKQYKLVDEL